MAWVSKIKKRYVIRFVIDGKEKKISGFTNEREASRVADKITALETAKKTGTMRPEVEVWLAEQAKKTPELYDKLASYGLAAERSRDYTLADLTQRFIVGCDCSDEHSKQKFYQTVRNLHERLGASKRIKEITYDDADDFRRWMETKPLNRRNKKAVPYSTATVNRRIKVAKQIFEYAIRHGMLDKSPFHFLKGGESVNRERWEYVSAEVVLRVISECPNKKWRAIIALIRFCGLRGSSELYQMTWDDLRLSTATEPFKVYVLSTKNKQHDKGDRLIQPIHPIVEQCLRDLMDEATIGQPRVFPGMKKNSNLGTPIEKYIKRAGVPIWQVPVKNMRKSFCCDFIECTSDAKFYEYVTDHSFTVAMRHYQILYPERMQKGFLNQKSPVENAVPAPLPAADVPPAGGPVSHDSSHEVRKVVRQKTVNQYVQGIPSTGIFLQQDSQTPIFYDSTQETTNACNFLQASVMTPTGIEPVPRP